MAYSPGVQDEISARSRADVKLGILIPEFPGQTHMFFWRELAALRALGAEPDLVSTRPPPASIISHTWAREAMAQTLYLSPLRLPELLRAGSAFLRSPTAGVLRVAHSVARAQGVDLKHRSRLLALAVVGARLADVARERGWRHIHAHSCADSAHVAMFASLLSGISYSVTLHGPLEDYGPNQHEKWRHAKFGIVITRKLLEEVGVSLRGSLPPVVDVAPMGVDVSRFVRSAPYQPWDGSGPLRVFSCGRLNPCKGHADLARAVALLRARGIDARLEIAGEDELGGSGYHGTLAREITAMGLPAETTLLGAISEDRVRAGLERAHVFALASLAEPLGVAVMEAMALGVPVVATNAGGLPELVRHGEHGLLVPAESPEALAAAIEQIARDPALAARLSRAARDRVVAEFDSTRSARTLMKHAAA